MTEQGRLNWHLNELDDKADVRDGIAQTKGKIMRASGEDISRLVMKPREQQTKIARMLRDMRFYLERERERKAQLKTQHQQQIETIDSEDEPERLDETEEVFIARPNPLEPQSKK